MNGLLGKWDIFVDIIPFQTNRLNWLCLLHALLTTWLDLRPWWWRQHAPSKRHIARYCYLTDLVVSNIYRYRFMETVAKAEQSTIIYEECCLLGCGAVYILRSEERIASIFRIEKSARREPASAGDCRLSHQSEITSYIRTGREGE
jgi:hypothetical protein